MDIFSALGNLALFAWISAHPGPSMVLLGVSIPIIKALRHVAPPAASRYRWAPGTVREQADALASLGLILIGLVKWLF